MERGHIAPGRVDHVEDNPGGPFRVPSQSDRSDGPVVAITFEHEGRILELWGRLGAGKIEEQPRRVIQLRRAVSDLLVDVHGHTNDVALDLSLNVAEPGQPAHFVKLVETLGDPWCERARWISVLKRTQQADGLLEIVLLMVPVVRFDRQAS